MKTPVYSLRMPLDIKKRIKRAAGSRRKTMSRFIIETMDRETKKLKPQNHATI